MFDRRFVGDARFLEGKLGEILSFLNPVDTQACAKVMISEAAGEVHWSMYTLDQEPLATAACDTAKRGVYVTAYSDKFQCMAGKTKRHHELLERFIEWS